MDRGVRAIVSHRLPNAEELNAGCGDWLDCCQAYIHTKGCVSDSARRAAEEIADYVSDGILGMGNEVTESDRVKFLQIINRAFTASPADNDAQFNHIEGEKGNP